MTMRQQNLPIEALEWIDERCAQFERDWQTGSAPDLQSVLPDDLPTPQREALLAELILLDVDYRRRRGQSPAEQEYLERFPGDRQAVRDAFHISGKPQAAFVPPAIERLGKLFPGLQILELIGAGGMGAVYKARQQGLDRLVALKVLPEEFGNDAKFALRFTREARTLAKLNHPNIVSVYEFGSVDGTFYFLMEYVEGSTLRAAVQSRQLGPEQALAVVPHLCDALQYAHDQGVIHRDIKPENILLGLGGSVKVADFGLARIIGNESASEPLTATHQIMGTPRYMAPEQLEATHSVDHRADIYSLGVVIYEMLTGELPIGRFAAPSAKVKIDVRLDEVVLRTLETEPQRRYQRASQIKSDVQSITSTAEAGDAPTEIQSPHGAASTSAGDAVNSSGQAMLEQQELAGRLVLTRRQLMQRVATSLRPLFAGQLVQLVFGVGLIALGAYGWTRNTEVPHRLLCGIIVHVYGVATVIAAAAVCIRIKQIDYSQSPEQISQRLGRVRSLRLFFGPLLGFAWWLLWIPVAVAIGFDEVVVYPNSLVPSLAIGVIGLVGSLGLYWRALRPGNPAAGRWRTKFAGGSLAAAGQTLREIQQAGIR